MANEKRLIDANALYTEVTEKYHDISAGRYPFNIVAYDMAQIVKNTPTVDAVEVVRCKDCKYGNITMKLPPNEVCCEFHDFTLVKAEDFCSCGERRDNA